MGYDAYAPFSGTEFDLATGEFLYEAQGIRIRSLPQFRRLLKLQGHTISFLPLDTVCCLLSVRTKDALIKTWRNFPEVQSLCDKWDRTDI